MPYLQLQDQKFPLPSGEATIGAFEEAVVRLPGGAPGVLAVVSVTGGGVVIRRGSPESEVFVNGVKLGVEPSPLLHGDRVLIGEYELRLGEDQKGGNTQFVSAADIAGMVAARDGSAPTKPTGVTGGRVVSLVDGREYPVSDAGLSFGREVENDVVIASTDISRRHAAIAPAAGGYVITDHSTNGVWVNGHRIAVEQILGRGDVIKMGTEEFRFYADAAPVEASAPAPAAVPDVPAPGPASAAVPDVPAPGPVAEPEPAPVPVVAVPPVPAEPAEPRRPPLATLEVINEGPLKGLRFELFSALTNIGRGEHNDISIRDESVSDSHAKIQKRGDGWWVVDQGSTNGTYVGGRRVVDEQRIEGAPDLRFGGIKMTFRAAVSTAVDGSGTRAIAAVNVDAARRAAARTPALNKQPAQPPVEAKKGCASVIAIFATVAGTGVGLLGLLLTSGMLN